MDQFQQNNNITVYKIVLNTNEGLISPFVGGEARINYPVGEWIENDTPMLVYRDLHIALPQIKNAIGFHSANLQLWQGVAPDCFPIYFLKRLTIPHITVLDMVSIRTFWKAYRKEFPGKNIVYSYEKYGNVMNDYGWVGFLPPNGTNGVFKLMLERKVYDGRDFEYGWSGEEWRNVVWSIPIPKIKNDGE